ncbi:hypothetical protein TUM3792_43300 [Shewanella sp. MBTL60-007]|nr:hypothetical protein TUM3792_43300 [Shewanella sp. MBTL60-007]
MSIRLAGRHYILISKDLKIQITYRNYLKVNFEGMGAKPLLERVAKGDIEISEPITFNFGHMPEALTHSEITKLKTVVTSI